MTSPFPSVPDCHGAYPLHYAAQMCASESSKQAQFVECLTSLLEFGADINVWVGLKVFVYLWIKSKLIMQQGAVV